MFTAESLLSIASEKEALYLELLAKYPSGTVNNDRDNASRHMQEALFCAEWMRSRGCTELANIGPFMTLNLKRGQFARVRKGSRVFGTGVQMPSEGKPTVRMQVVRVHDLEKGHVGQIGCAWTVCQGTLRWASSGGGWRWTDVNNVDAI